MQKEYSGSDANDTKDTKDVDFSLQLQVMRLLYCRAIISHSNVHTLVTLVGITRRRARATHTPATVTVLLLLVLLILVLNHIRADSTSNSTANRTKETTTCLVRSETRSATA